MAIFLVFAVLLIEFRSIIQPLAIVLGAVLALFGVVAALAITGTSLNIVSFLGAIIGVGIVAKNGILMLDFVEHLRARGYSAVRGPGAIGATPAAAGADDLAGNLYRATAAGLRHGAGRTCCVRWPSPSSARCSISLLFSLIVTPVCYYVMMRLLRLDKPLQAPTTAISESDGQPHGKSDGKSDGQPHGVIHAQV